VLNIAGNGDGDMNERTKNIGKSIDIFYKYYSMSAMPRGRVNGVVIKFISIVGSDATLKAMDKACSKFAISGKDSKEMAQRSLDYFCGICATAIREGRCLKKEGSNE
jgi:hypothetical protein